MAQSSLFEEPNVTLAPGALLLRGFALAELPDIYDTIQNIVAAAPLRHLITPGGFRMSVAMTNCGEAGWVSDRKGYRYEAKDPESGKPWPAMPGLFASLAKRAAAAAGFPNHAPNVCLINHYEPGSRLTLHQDRDEGDFSAPIVSVSLGLPATFLFGGDQRNGKTQRYVLESGDVVVWGGPARLAFHGVAPLKDGAHPLTGRCRFNLTFRTAKNII
jgi:alkylated DNA repair protein (DNA oxidative demethylase)